MASARGPQALGRPDSAVPGGHPPRPSAPAVARNPRARVAEVALDEPQRGGDAVPESADERGDEDGGERLREPHAVVAPDEEVAHLHEPAAHDDEERGQEPAEDADSDEEHELARLRMHGAAQPELEEGEGAVAGTS